MEDKSIPVVLAELSLHMEHLREGQTRLSEDIKGLRGEVKEVREDVGKVPGLIDEKLNGKLAKFVTRETFDALFSPVQRLVFSLVGLVLTGVVGGLLAVVLRSKGVLP